jgi:hypothetical protein
MNGLPYDVCGCECHRPVDLRGNEIEGRPNGQLWPKFDDLTARISACAKCWPDHEEYIKATAPSSPFIFVVSK